MPPLLLLKFFANPKVLIGILITAVVAYGWLKYNSLQSTIADQAAIIKQEKDNNAVLRGNVETLKQINLANERILEQQQLTAQAATQTINKLAKEIQASTKSFSNIQSRIDSINDAPVPLTSYLKEAITGIQEQRSALAEADPATLELKKAPEPKKAPTK